MQVPLTEVAYMNLSMEMKYYWLDNTNSPHPPPTQYYFQQNVGSLPFHLLFLLE